MGVLLTKQLLSRGMICSRNHQKLQQKVAQLMYVMSWNVLANSYALPKYFPHADEDYLTSHVRTDITLARIEGTLPDVVALQEVEVDFLTEFINKFGHYYTIRFMYAEGKPAGIMTAVKRKYELIDQCDIQITCDSMILTVRHNYENIILVNNHVKWAPADTLEDNHPGVRQMEIVLDTVDQMMRKHNADKVIICGDFNDAPSGPVRSLLRKNYVERQFNCATSLFGNGEERFLDVIATRGIYKAEPEFRVSAALAVPSYKCPSDHVPLQVNVKI